MTREQYLIFRNAFVEKRMSQPAWADELKHFGNEAQEAMDTILNAVCLAMCKKIPEGLNKDHEAIAKIKLVPL